MHATVRGTDTGCLGNNSWSDVFLTNKEWALCLNSGHFHTNPSYLSVPCFVSLLCYCLHHLLLFLFLPHLRLVLNISTHSRMNTTWCTLCVPHTVPQARPCPGAPLWSTLLLLTPAWVDWHSALMSSSYRPQTMCVWRLCCLELRLITGHIKAETHNEMVNCYASSSFCESCWDMMTLLLHI